MDSKASAQTSEPERGETVLKPTSGRNKGFEATHETIIKAAVRLISDKGVEALTMASVSRAAQINRTTLYYHFADRDALIHGVKDWSGSQLARGFAVDLPRKERVEQITRFVLENSELVSLFIDDFLSPGDIRTRYGHWDDLVAGIERDLGTGSGDSFDAEIYSVILLTAAFIAPRVYRNSVRPDLPLEEVVARFSREHLRVLARDGLQEG